MKQFLPQPHESAVEAAGALEDVHLPAADQRRCPGSPSVTPPTDVPEKGAIVAVRTHAGDPTVSGYSAQSSLLEQHEQP